MGPTTLWPAAVVVVAAATEAALGAPITADVVGYLRSFGYLPAEGASAMISEEQAKSAISNLQFFAGLRPTGEVDEATKALLAAPRCGVHDVSAAEYRNKRSIQNPSRHWRHRRKR